MNRILASLVCLIALIACKQQPKVYQQITSEDVEVPVIDTIDISLSDSLEMQEIFSDKTYPEKQRSWESFGDFLITFVSDSLEQVKRIDFPLKYQSDNNTQTIAQASWRYDSLFLAENCYTMLFDDEADMEMIGDTLQQNVRLDWYLLNEKVLKCYQFVAIHGKWMLNGIEETKRKGSDNDFISFYTRFVNDSIFQRKHICMPLQYVTLDPDDEFSVLETSLDIDQWFAFKPLLPIRYLSNIAYGQSNDDTSKVKIVRVNGLDNGYTTIYYFRRLSKGWELYRYEDTSI